MKTCPQCFGTGKEVDEKGFNTGYKCPTCGGSGEVTNSEYNQFHNFYGSDDAEYVDESWRISRKENRLHQLDK